tara:strand:+ start:58 stop:201 length:144 start_codon:yes stop_codon:yes gene_type:complete
MKKVLKDKLIQIRVTQDEKEELTNKAKESGFSSVGEYLRVKGKQSYK